MLVKHIDVVDVVCTDRRDDFHCLRGVWIVQVEITVLTFHFLLYSPLEEHLREKNLKR